MIRGTTAQFKIKLPCLQSQLDVAQIIVGQEGNRGTIDAELPIKRIITDFPEENSIEDSTELSISLTPAETMRFSDKRKACIQFRAWRKDQTVFGNRPKYITVYPMSDDILDSDTTLSDESSETVFTLGSKNSILNSQ